MIIFQICVQTMAVLSKCNSKSRVRCNTQRLTQHKARQTSNWRQNLHFYRQHRAAPRWRLTDCSSNRRLRIRGTWDNRRWPQPLPCHLGPAITWLRSIGSRWFRRSLSRNGSASTLTIAADPAPHSCATLRGSSPSHDNCKRRKSVPKSSSKFWRLCAT